METQLTPKEAQLPQFSAHICCGQMAGWIKMTLGTEVGLSPSDIVLHGDPATPLKVHGPQFSAHVYCGQTAGWMKMHALGTEVDISPGHILLDRDPALPLFGPSMSFVATVVHLSYC